MCFLCTSHAVGNCDTLNHTVKLAVWVKAKYSACSIRRSVKLSLAVRAHGIKPSGCGSLM